MEIPERRVASSLQGPDRTGGGSCTLAVDDIQETIDDLKELNVDPGKLMAGELVKTVMIKDPDGNSIAFAQALSPKLAQ